MLCAPLRANFLSGLKLDGKLSLAYRQGPSRTLNSHGCTSCHVTPLICRPIVSGLMRTKLKHTLVAPKQVYMSGLKSWISIVWPEFWISSFRSIPSRAQEESGCDMHAHAMSFCNCCCCCCGFNYRCSCCCGCSCYGCHRIVLCSLAHFNECPWVKLLWHYTCSCPAAVHIWLLSFLVFETAH